MVFLKKQFRRICEVRQEWDSDSRIDFYILMLIAFLSMGIGSSYITVNGDYARFYQGEYGPAVMIALGKGYHNPVASEVPGLKEFLWNETRELNVDVLPQDIAIKELTALQIRWRYLLTTVGYIWRVFGINWDSIICLYLTFFTAVNCFSYLIARNFLPRIWALLIGLLLVFSALNLHYLPQLRDYSKAPFILCYIFLVFRLFKKERSRSATYGYFSLLGIVGGVGLGFRADMIILIPISLLIAVTMVRNLHPETSIWRAIGYKISVCIVFLFAFTIAGFPILSGRSSTGSNSFHVLILGHAEVYDEVAGIGGVNYSFDTHYKDAYVYTLGVSYAKRVGLFADDEVIEYQSKNYDIATGAYYKSLIALIPADFYLRTYRTFENILNYLPFTTPATEGLFKNALLKSLFEIRWSLLGFLSGFGLLFFIFNSFVFTYRNARNAWLFVIIFLYFLSYPSLQLRERHYFHLESLYWLNVALFFYLSSGFLYRIIFRPDWRFVFSKDNGQRILKTTTILMVAIILFFAGLMSLRFIQEKNLKHYFSEIQTTEFEPIPFQVDAIDGKYLINFSAKKEAFSHLKGRTDFVTNYVKLKLKLSGNSRITIHYKGVRATNLTSVYPYRTNGNAVEETVEFYFPIYETAVNFRMRGERTFDGISISGGENCEVLSIERLVNTSSLGFLPVLLLSPDRDQMSYYVRSISGKLPLYPKILWRRKHNILSRSYSDEKLDIETREDSNLDASEPQSEVEERSILILSENFKLQMDKKYELYVDALVAGDVPAYLQIRREGRESIVEFSIKLEGKDHRIIRSLEFLPNVIENCDYRLVAVFPRGLSQSEINWNHLYLTQIDLETIR